MHAEPFIHPQARLLVMGRAPVAGSAKTRLIPALGAEGAARLHGVLLERIVRTAVESRLSPVEFWCAPDHHHPAFAALASRWPITLHDQPVGDIGQCMHAALASALEDAEFVVLVGSDCPAFTVQDLADAHAALAGGADAVVVPVEDGGYTLIGVRRATPALFEEITWSSPQVMAEQRARFLALGWKWEELRTLWDVDRPADLARLEDFGL